MELMFAQLMKLAGRNEDASSAHHKYRPCPARCPSLQTYLPPPPPSLATICIAAQRTGDSNVMAFRNLLQSTFMQSILSFIPSLRHSLPALPQQAEATPPALSPTRAAPTPPVLTPVSVAPWKEEADRWKTLADTTAAERDELRHEAGRLHGELQRLVHDLGQVRAEAEEAWRTQEADLRREGAAALREAEERARAEAQEAVRRADENVQKAREELQALLAELEESRKEQGGLRDTLEARRVQLEELQRVVGEDKVGDADVMQLLKNLNEEIAKSALAVRDLFKLDRNSRPNGRVATDAAGAIEGWVGSALPGLLSKQYRGNAVLLQAALQAMAVAFSSWISSSYSFMHEHDQILDETYKFVMNSENQIVLGRWRALTHRYAKQGMPNLVDELTKMFLTDVRNLLLVAGSSTMQIDTLMSRTRDSFRAIVDAAIKLRTAIGEDIITCDFETILIHPGDMYDGASMDDAYEGKAKSDAGAANAKNVLCTSGLGLRRCKKVKVDGDAATQWEVVVLQKPQVVLHSAIGQ